MARRAFLPAAYEAGPTILTLRQARKDLCICGCVWNAEVHRRPTQIQARTI